uniref:Ubiquitin-like protease family profile domain-containing protein n=1 Tax=Panagrolaimus davidi TaxID=227884 RepID=A0A914Q3W4_9BILA
MSTKNDKHLFIEKTFTASENQYYNLNLNQSEKCPVLIPVLYNGKSEFNKSSKISTFTTLNEDNDDKKRWNNKNFLNTANKISNIYEISPKTVGLNLFVKNEHINGLKKETFGTIKTSTKRFANIFKFENPFEFARQQREDDGKNEPEIMHFKSSQHLMRSSRDNGRKRKRKRDDEPSGSFQEPSSDYLNNNRKILLFSEGKHKSFKDLFLDDNQINALICGVAAFVSKKGIRKFAVLPSIFSTILAADPKADPILYMNIFKSDYDILLAPIGSDDHWYLATFFVDEKIVTVYDSLHWPVPSIFPRLKNCIESVLHVQFTEKNDNQNVTKQQNGYDCGVNCYRNAEEICFHGKCNLFDPYYPEAERARAREILRRLKNKEIKDQWVPAVVTSTHYTTLNRPTDEPEKEVTEKSSDDNSDVEVLDESDDDKKDETNICDISIGCLNDPIQKMGLHDSMNVDEEQKSLTNDEESQKDDTECKLLSVDEEIVLNKESLETAAEFCTRKRIKNDNKGKSKHQQSVKAAKETLAKNEKQKEYMMTKIKNIKTEERCSDTVRDYVDINEDLELMTNAEELKVQNESKENYAAYCKRLKISTKTSRNKYNVTIKNAKEKLAENERLKECMRKKRLTESAEEKSQRLQQVAESMQALRENETEDEKKERLQKDAEAKQKLRENETEEQKKGRLQKDAELKQNIRDNENEEEKKQRLNDDKTQKSIQRTINKIEKKEKLKKERAERIAKIKELLPAVLRKASDYTNVEPFRLGKRDKICKGCGAKHYRTEKVQKNGTYTSCCKQGKIKMESGVPDFPQNLKELMTKTHANKEYTKAFNTNIRMINSSLSCAHIFNERIG